MSFLKSSLSCLAVCAAGLLGPALASAGTPSPPGQICIGSTCTTTTVSTSSGIRFHPGHYVLLDPVLKRGGAQASTHFSQISEICNMPEWKGVELIMYWNAYEGDTAGDYSAGRSLVQQYLNKLGACGKYLHLQIWPHTFGSSSAASAYFPAYLVNGSDYGISNANISGGYQARLWEQATMDRFIAMFKDIATQFKDNSYLESVSPGETSVNVSAGNDGYSVSGVITQYKRLFTALRSAFPNQQIRLGANYLGSDTQMKSMIDHCIPLNCLIGGPDTLPGEAIQGNEIYAGNRGGTDLRNVLPFVAEVQSPELGGKEGTWTPSQLWNAANNGYTTPSGTTARAVHPNYFIWYRNTYSGGSAQMWSTGIRPFVEDTLGGVVKYATCTLQFSCLTN